MSGLFVGRLQLGQSRAAKRIWGLCRERRAFVHFGTCSSAAGAADPASAMKTGS